MSTNQSTHTGQRSRKVPYNGQCLFLDVNVVIFISPSVSPQGKGYDTSRHVLACFGGAGGQHACAIARNLGMSTVFIHR